MIALKVSGTSMYPLVRDGDILLGTDSASGKLHPGDIVLYEIEKKLFAHRLIWKAHDIYWIKADTHFFFEKIHMSQVEGKVKGIVRNGRIIDLTAPFNRILNLLFAICLLPVSFVYNLCMVMN